MIDLYNFYESDPEFMDILDKFNFGEVINEENQELGDVNRYLSALACLIGCGGLEQYKIVLDEALESKVTPIMVKEVVYQSINYVGSGKTYTFLIATNEVMKKRNIKLPLENQGTVSELNRIEKGSELQVEIFGDGMKEFWKKGHINRWLAGNCFGDYYTRQGLDLNQREMITFCFLLALGGCESQLMSHIYGNVNLGNDITFLLRVVSQSLPYIGYPRSLNGITALNKVKDTLEGGL